jgi:predicted RNA-binding protein
LRRNGEEFFFLTDEEREIAREIKNIDLLAADEAKAIAGLIYADVLGDDRTFRFSETKKDFQFTRLCDLHPYRSTVR